MTFDRCFGDIFLGFGEQDDLCHRPWSRVRTRTIASAAGTGCVAPARYRWYRYGSAPYPISR
jgi:hypothetical protein